jgi:predicted FMN-binding regulatory protein PaiB
MAATNYSKPVGNYRLVRVRGVKSRILDPHHLDRILSILERDEEDELWQALAASQPFGRAPD